MEWGSGFHWLISLHDERKTRGENIWRTSPLRKFRATRPSHDDNMLMICDGIVLRMRNRTLSLRSIRKYTQIIRFQFILHIGKIFGSWALNERACVWERAHLNSMWINVCKRNFVQHWLTARRIHIHIHISSILPCKWARAPSSQTHSHPHTHAARTRVWQWQIHFYAIFGFQFSMQNRCDSKPGRQRK